MFLRILISLAAGYLLGSVVSAILISRLVFKEDVRLKGSGNSGATNAARVYGIGFGVLTFAGDFIKGILACLTGWYIGGVNALEGLPYGGYYCLAAAGAACMIGHCFPLFFNFKGGKAVSVGAAVALMIDWRVFVIGISVFIVIALITKIVSLGSILGSAAVGISALFIGDHVILKLLGLLAAVIVIVRHTSNIRRILDGTEKKFSIEGS